MEEGETGLQDLSDCFLSPGVVLEGLTVGPDPGSPEAVTGPHSTMFTVT